MDDVTANAVKKDSERNILIKSWQKAFERATDFDAWGQPVEALDIYQRLYKQVHSHSNSKESILFPLSQKKVLEKITHCLDARKRSLNTTGPGHEEYISLKELKLLKTTLENLLINPSVISSDSQQFPVDLATISSQLTSFSFISDCSVDISPSDGEVFLLPKPMPAAGKTYLTICIDYMGVKDSSQFLDPYMSICVKFHLALSGQSLSCIQNTPTPSSKVDSTINFNSNVHIDKALESLPQGFAIFFEFKHFKPKKNAYSVHCWAFLEQDEMKEGSVALELYKKPADYQRKSLKLLTVKPLFLHLNLNLYN